MNNLENMILRIKTLKKELGYTNDTLAEKTEIPKSTLDKILTQVIKDPSITSIMKIARALNVTTDFLIFGIEPISAPKTSTASLSSDESELINNYNKLNTIGKDKAQEYTKDLTDNEKYTAPSEELKNKLHA